MLPILMTAQSVRWCYSSACNWDENQVYSCSGWV